MLPLAMTFLHPWAAAVGVAAAALPLAIHLLTQAAARADSAFNRAICATGDTAEKGRVIVCGIFSF